MKINQIMKYGVLGGIFAILFIPFIVANHQFFPFITGKGFVFRIAIEIIFAVWAILALRDRSYLPKFSWITGAVLIFMAIIGIADIFGQNPYKSFWSNYERMEGFIGLAHLLLYYLVVSSMLKTEKLWKIFLNTSIGASVLMAIYGFFQLAGVLVINQGGVRVDGTFGNATYLAVYMLVNMFFASFLFLRTKEKLYLRIAYVVAFIMQAIILYHTATRGAILGVIGGIAVSALLIAIFSKGNKTARLGSIGALVVILAIIGGFFAIRNTDFVKGSQTLGRFTSINSESIKSQGRYFVWPMAWKGFKEHPILGWGQENFNYVFNKNYDPKMYSQEQWFDRTHNIFLDWLVNAGALGFLSYIGLYVALMFYLWKGKNSFSLIEKSILTGFIAGYVFQNIFVFDNLISYILFFSVLAFVHAMSVKEKEPVKWLSKISSNYEIAERVAIPVLVVVLAITLYFGNIKPILANRTLIDAIDYGKSTPEQSLANFKKVFTYNTFADSEASEQFLSATPRFATQNIPTDIKNEFFKLAKQELVNRVNTTPTDTRYLLFTGNVLTQMGEYKEALTYLERAHETSPGKQNIYFAIGAAYISMGPSQFENALQAFKKGYDLEPSYPEAKIIYGIGAIYNKNYKLAAEILKTVDVGQSLFDDRILSAYYVSGNFSEVVNILEARIKVEPNNTESHFRLAASYFQVGQKSKSIEELKKAAALDPNLKQQADYLIGEIQAGRNPIK
jgi:O-antigen ligase/cytochrome c-type biogenesis protein CcmH/NrfG